MKLVRIFGFLVAVALPFGGLATFATGTPYAVASRSAPHVVVDTCPPLYSGDWSGTWASTDFPGAGGSIVGTIVADSDTFNGSFELTGSVLPGGTLTGTIACDQFTGTFDDGAGDTVTIAGTLAPDGRSLDTTYVLGNDLDHGTMTITIASSNKSAAIGDTSAFENGGTTVAAATTLRPPTRNIQVPVTLEEPAATVTTIHYKLVDGTATRGVDYKDTGKVHALNFNAGQSEKNIAVAIYSNVIRPDNRSFGVQLVDASGGYLIFNALGTVTILADH